MTNKRPTEQEIREIASRLCTLPARLYNGDVDIRESATDMLYAIADHLSKSEPVAWTVWGIGKSLVMNCAFKMKEDALSYAESLRISCEVVPLYTPPTADAEDARRYRWLRDVSRPEHGMFYLSVWAGLHQIKWTPEQVDKTIDDAMTRSMQGESHDH